jgi:hypothetical protein
VVHSEGIGLDFATRCHHLLTHSIITALLMNGASLLVHHYWCIITVISLPRRVPARRSAMCNPRSKVITGFLFQKSHAQNSLQPAPAEANPFSAFS